MCKITAYQKLVPQILPLFEINDWNIIFLFNRLKNVDIPVKNQNTRSIHERTWSYMSTCIHTWFICVHKWFICFHMWNHICSCVYINENWGNMYIYYHMCSYVFIHFHTWSYVFINENWGNIYMYDHIWSYMNSYDHIWILYGGIWTCMTSNDFIYEHKWVHTCS